MEREPSSSDPSGLETAESETMALLRRRIRELNNRHRRHGGAYEEEHLRERFLPAHSVCEPASEVAE